MSAIRSLTSSQDKTSAEASPALPAYLVTFAAGLAFLVLLTTWLWWRYGTALFVDMAVSALNICF